MTILSQDIRYGARMLAKSPVATAVAIVSLGLGIGANTAIFSLMNALILRSLPVRDPGQLIRLSTMTPQSPDREDSLSLAMYQQLRKDQRVFSYLFAWSGGGMVNLEANGVKYAASLSTVTGEYFSTLRIQPHLGRWIVPDDLSLEAARPLSPYSAMVAGRDARRRSRHYRQDHSGRGSSAHHYRGDAGELLRPDHRFAVDVTVPIRFSGRTTYRDRKSFGLDVFARLKPEISIEQARVQLESIWPAISGVSSGRISRGAARRISNSPHCAGIGGDGKLLLATQLFTSAFRSDGNGRTSASHRMREPRESSACGLRDGGASLAFVLHSVRRDFASFARCSQKV
jgi:MacB-like periplasmic core domain